MCGIGGIYNYRHGQPVAEALLRRMTGTMVHRGPDDEGFFVSGALGLGMRRLSIIDLSGGRQPIHNEDETVWVTFNGEIYNYRELRAELERQGHRFYTRSDTEVIVHSYEEWGDDCVLHLNGIFGLAVWDEPRRRLLLARDHYGVKPLYYYDDGSRLLWGSEIKAILADPAVPRRVDPGALDLFLTFRFVPSPATLFQGLGKLPPGHRLVATSQGCRLERFWRPRPRLDHSLSEADQVTLLQERLQAAVNRQMVSDVPIGALLSGGIDSGVIVALMSQATDQPVRTFTVGFKDDEKISELKEARQTAARFGTEHYEVELHSLDYQQWLQEAVWHLEEPIATTSALAMYFVCQLAHQHVKVVLTGQGSDEPHAGYHRYLGEHYGPAFRKIPASLREQVLRPLVDALPRQERLKRAVRSLGLEEAAARFVQVYAVFPESLKEALWRPEHRPNLDRNLSLNVVRYWLQGIEHLNSLVQMAYVDARLSLSDDLLMYGDKMSMAHSIEARVPFLDLEYMAVAESLPPSFRIRGLTRKYLHKKAVSKWLPADMIHRPKLGFATPIDRWFRAELLDYVRFTLLSKDAACMTYFTSDTITSLIQEHVTGRQDHQRLLFSLLIFELWHRRFIKGNPV